MKAKSKTQYREAWTKHVNQLALLALDAGVSPTEWAEMTSQLLGWIEAAATQLKLED